MTRTNIIQETCFNRSILKHYIEADLIIFITGTSYSSNEQGYGTANIIKIDSEGRPIIGSITHNFKNFRTNNYNNDDWLIQTKIIFLHQITHILGFRKDILKKYNLMFTEISTNRTDRWNAAYSNKTFINSTKVIDLAKKYYNCPFINSIEIEDYNSTNNDEGEYNIHWHSRYLLGEYMSHDFYYLDTYISEFTLALLEDLKWYKANYYTGGLMRFGKYKGCNFTDKDCFQIIDDKISTPFPNEFCTSYYDNKYYSDDYYKKKGTCSSGRQSMGLCYDKTDQIIFDKIYRRKNIEYVGHGFIEYCPISDEVKAFDSQRTNEQYYRGSCNIGNSRYGELIDLADGENGNKIYSQFSDIIMEKYSNESFCALSSLIRKDENSTSLTYVNKLIRPTCYQMFCSNESLTIQVDNEYFVCPRKGGILQIDEWSNYKGILYCPDYNLICTGTVVCNDLFNCVEKKSESKFFLENYNYDYSNENISIILKTNEESRITEFETPVIGYELSENGKCPPHCRQCISNYQCTLCESGYQNYVGTKENDTNPILCYPNPPGEGYYITTQYVPGKNFYFTCIENCLECNATTKDICLKCDLSHYIKDGKCVERIPGCKDYDESSIKPMADNRGGNSYTLCENCNNTDGYYCFNMNTSTCIRMEDYNMTLNLTLYYDMEEKDYSCIQRCDERFEGGCETCNKDKCTKCYDTSRLINNAGNCIESIDNCNRQDLTLEYKSCIQCDYQNNYYCIKENRSECVYISPQNFTSYYRYEENNDSCVDLCVEKYQSHCLTCNYENCTKCEEGYYIHKGQCFQNITGCIYNYFVESLNETQCDLCDSNSDYYCINQNKSICNTMNSTTLLLYYSLPDLNYPCYGLCHNLFPNCINCTSQYCYKCTEEYLINRNKTKCLLLPHYLNEKAACEIKIFEYNKTLDKDNIDFSNMTQDYYATVNSTSVVHHYIGNNFTITLYINSNCTDGLFNKGHFSIDTNELNQTMVIESEIELLRQTIGIYVNYNYKSHFRFYDLEFYYLNPEILCPSCFITNYTTTHDLYYILKQLYGQKITDYILKEELDIFDPDLDIYKDTCHNVTLSGIDIPINLRKNILYKNKENLSGILCNDIDCDLVDINYETRTSTCKCRMGNKYEDIFVENDIIISYNEEITKAKGFAEALTVITCMNNGFDYISTNLGFYICLIVFILQLICYVAYCCCGKPLINLDKKNSLLVANPPKEEKTTRIFLFSDWNLDLKSSTNKNPNLNLNEEVIQPRDESEDQILEEEKSVNKDVFNLSDISIDTNAGGLFPDKNSNRNSKILEKNKRVLILLGNKPKKKISLDQSINKEINSEGSDEKPLGDRKKLRKVSFAKNYWIFLSIKQHIINYFSDIKCCKITESYIPLTMRFVRSLFIIALGFLVNIIWLDQKYFEKKFNHFNDKYGIINSSKTELKISYGERFSYAFSHTIIYGLISFVILTLADFIIGCLFFGFRNEVEKVLVKNKTSKVQDMVLKARRNYNIFFVLNIILLVIFVLSFIGFEATYQGATFDYLSAGIIALVLNEILPFLWSLVLALLRYLGIKKKSKCLLKFSEFFLY